MAKTKPEKEKDNEHPNGRVVRVIGPVVDVEFPPAQLPEINTALRIDVALGGKTTTITCEVAQHIGESVVRTIAMKPTDEISSSRRSGSDTPSCRSKYSQRQARNR